MTDVSIQATGLSPVTGEGTQPLEPVKTRAINTSLIPILGKVGEVFAESLAEDRKKDAKSRETAILSEYTRNENLINSGVIQGRMSPQEAAKRSRILYSEYVAAHPGLENQITGIAKGLRDFGSKKDVVDPIEEDNKRREKSIDFARSKGYQIPPGAGEAVIQSTINAAYAQEAFEKDSQKALEAARERRAISAEARAQGTYDASLEEKANKKETAKLLGTLANSEFDQVHALALDLHEQVKNGKMDEFKAKVFFTERMTKIEMAINAISVNDPTMGAGYKASFDKIRELGLKGMDVKEQSESLKAELATTMTRAKIAAVSDPSVAAVVATSELLGHSPYLAQLVVPAAVKAIALAGRLKPGDKEVMPQVIGTPEEADFLALFKNALNSVVSGKVKDKLKADDEMLNTVNQVLKQTGKLINDGAIPVEKLQPLAQVLAHPDYAKFINNRNIDKEGASAAAKVFQLNYEKVLVKNVGMKLDEFLYEQADFSRKNGNKPPELLKDRIDITFQNGNVKFSPKTDTKNLDPLQQKDLEAKVKDLAALERTISHVVKVAAHIEGRTDYDKVWEERKHQFFPKVFSQYEGLEIGFTKVVGDRKFKYIGGNAKNPDNWKELK